MRNTLKYKVAKVTKLEDKPATFRRGEYKCRLLETHSKLIEQQQKTVCIQTAISKSHGNCQSKIYTRYANKKGIQAQIPKLVIKSQENKRGREEERPYKNKFKRI